MLQKVTYLRCESGMVAQEQYSDGSIVEKPIGDIVAYILKGKGKE